MVGTSLREELMEVQQQLARSVHAQAALTKELNSVRDLARQASSDGSRNDGVYRQEVRKLTAEVYAEPQRTGLSFPQHPFFACSERLTVELVESQDDNQKKDLKLATQARQMDKLNETARRASELRDELDEALAEVQRLKKFEASTGKLKARIEMLEVAETRVRELEEDAQHQRSESVRVEAQLADLVVLRPKLKVGFLLTMSHFFG